MYVHACSRQGNSKTVEQAFRMHVLVLAGHSLLFFLENLKWKHKVQEKVIYSVHVDVL